MLRQARSLRLYLDRSLASEVVVVENPDPGSPVDWRDPLRREYGDLAGRVRFLDAGELGGIPRHVSGWVAQQILKLMAARVVATDRYVVLDAKNHLLHPLARDYFEAADGRLRSRLVDYADHPLRPRLQDTLAYFGLAAERHVGSFLPTTTPFAFSTAVVRDAIAHLEAQEGAPFPLAFVHSGRSFTEFFLVGAYVLATGAALEDLYEPSGTRCETVWPESSESDVLAAVARCESEARPFFAVHRRALPQLSAEARLAIDSLWRRRGLA